MILVRRFDYKIKPAHLDKDLVHSYVMHGIIKQNYSKGLQIASHNQPPNNSFFVMHIIRHKRSSWLGP